MWSMPGLVGYQSRLIDITHQAHGFPGDSQTALGFRTDGNKLEKLPQGLGNVAVVFVPAVKTDFFSQQTGTDADLYRRMSCKI